MLDLQPLEARKDSRRGIISAALADLPTSNTDRRDERKYLEIERGFTATDLERRAASIPPGPPRGRFNDTLAEA
jgi:hypothetical protein